MNEWMNESYNGKIEFLAAFTPVFSVTWSLISAQETFLIIINFENYFCCLIFLCKFWYTTIWVLPVWELIFLFSKDTLKISVLYNCLLVPNFWPLLYIYIYLWKQPYFNKCLNLLTVLYIASRWKYWSKNICFCCHTKAKSIKNK